MYWQIFSDNRSYPTLLQNCSTGCALAMPAHDSSPADFSMQSRPSYKEVRKYTLPQAKAEAGSAVCFSFLFVYMLSSSSAYLLLSSLQHTKLEYRNQDNHKEQQHRIGRLIGKLSAAESLLIDQYRNVCRCCSRSAVRHRNKLVKCHQIIFPAKHHIDRKKRCNQWKCNLEKSPESCCPIQCRSLIKITVYRLQTRQ